MTKFIISAGFGREWQGTFENRFDTVLIDTLEKLRGLPYGERGNPQRRRDLEAIICARMEELEFHCDIAQMCLYEVPLGKRFMIDNYDGAEYVITEDQLIHVA
jgi:hypothetical protein